MQGTWRIRSVLKAELQPHLQRLAHSIADGRYVLAGTICCFCPQGEQLVISAASCLIVAVKSLSQKCETAETTCAASRTLAAHTALSSSVIHSPRQCVVSRSDGDWLVFCLMVSSAQYTNQCIDITVYENLTRAVT